MKARASGLAVIAVATVVATLGAQSGFSRVVLQDQPLSAPDRHAVSARADFAPGGHAGRHTHPGEEIGYILEGTVELSVEGRATVSLRQGDVFFIPAHFPHGFSTVSPDVYWLNIRWDVNYPNFPAAK